MTQDELQALCDEWRGRLRLSEWRVVARFVKRHKIAGAPRAQASCEHVFSLKAAEIEIVDTDGEEQSVFWDDVESVLVHELLHCHFSGFMGDSETPEGKLQEQVIQQLALALVALKRDAQAYLDTLTDGLAGSLQELCERDPDAEPAECQAPAATTTPCRHQATLNGACVECGATGDELLRQRLAAIEARRRGLIGDAVQLPNGAQVLDGGPRPSYGPLPGCEGVKI